MKDNTLNLVNPFIFQNPSVTRTAPRLGKAKTSGKTWIYNDRLGRHICVVNKSEKGKPLTRSDSYLCTIVNDKDGETFLTELRKAFPLSSRLKVTTYGRNPDRKGLRKAGHSFGSAVPKALATYRDVYLSEKYEHEYQKDLAYFNTRSKIAKIQNSNLPAELKSELISDIIDKG